MFTNKHFIAAMIVTPVLAVLAYFAVDFAVSEKPQELEAGKTYKLAARSDCRYESGKCTLHNGDVEMVIRAEEQNSGEWLFTLTSDISFDAAALVVVPPEDTSTPPVNMKAVNTENLEDQEPVFRWNLLLPPFDKETDKLRVIVSENGSFFHAETMAIFPEFVTPFIEPGAS